MGLLNWLRSAFVGNAMNALRRGLNGAMIGAGIVCVVVFWGSVSYDIPWRTFIALAALAGLLVGCFGGVSACSPRNRMRVLTSIGAVAGFALLASPIVAMALRNWEVELSGLSYLPPIFAGLFGGVITVVNEAGYAARIKRGDFENPVRATAHDNRLFRIDRLWLWTSLVAWLVIAAYMWWELNITWKLHGVERLGPTFLCLLWGGILMLYFVGIPFRIVLNLIFKERRRQRLLETIMCVIAFTTLTSVFVMAVRSYPSDW